MFGSAKARAMGAEVQREAGRRSWRTSTTTLSDFEAAVAHVAAGHCRRICMPGRWVVWMPEGETKPRAQIFNHAASQEATLCNCS